MTPAMVELPEAGVVETVIRPCRPYSLAASAGHSDLTRRYQGGVFDLALQTARGPARMRVWQRPDGDLVARVNAPDTAAALDRLRFVLATDVDHTPFLRAAASDPLLGRAVRRSPGLRPARLGTVTHALVRAVCGQLVTAREGVQIERRLLRGICAPAGDLRLPPEASDLARLSAAGAERSGLSPRRSAALVRVSRTLDLERLRAVPAQAAVKRLCAEPGLGPWSAGIVAAKGLGSYAHGPVGDLGLIKLCSALLDRPAEVADTAALLDRYGDWAALAGAHMLSLPLAHTRTRRRERLRA